MQHVTPAAAADRMPWLHSEGATREGPSGSPTPSLRRLLIRLLFLMQLPVLVAAAVMLYSHQQAERELTSNRLSTFTLALSSALHERMMGIERELEPVTALLPALASDLPALHQRASAARLAAGVDAIVVLDAEGRPLINTWHPPGTALPAAPEPMREAVRTGRSSYNGLAVSPYTGRYITGLGLPVLHDERLAYVVNAVIHTESYQNLVQALQLPVGWSASLLDANGTVVAHEPPEEGVVGQPAARQLLEQVTASESGFVETRLADGSTAVTSFRTSPVMRWTAVVTVPEAALYGPVVRTAGLLALLFAVANAVALAVALRVRQRVSQAVERLRAGAMALAFGQPVPPVSRLDFVEAEAVQDALHIAADRIHSAYVQVNESEQRLAAIVHTALDAIVVSDAHHRIVLANEAALRMFGLEHPATGTSVRRLLSAESWASYLRHLRTSGPRPPHRQTHPGVGSSPHGTFPLEYSVATFSDAHGARYATLIARDVTERVRSEEFLRAARQKMRRMNQDFQRALLRELDAHQATIARELHDAVGSSLAGVNLLLGSAQAVASDDRVHALIEKSQEQVRLATERIRQISRGIMPAGSEQGALLQALEQFAADASQIRGVRCFVHSRGDYGDVPAAVASHLYRIVQEATNNALRHGNATCVRITLARVGSHCRLTVRDNGSGCDLSLVRKVPHGLGLRSMHARARAIDGDLAMWSPLGRGCKVQVTWPAAAREEAGAPAQEQPV